MSLPVDPTLDCSAAEYSLGSGRNRALSNPQTVEGMYSPKTPRQEQQPRPIDSPSVPKGKLERLRDYIGNTCCSWFLKLPMLVILIVSLIIIVLLVVLIPTVVILTNSEREPQRQFADGVEVEVIRGNHFFPKPDTLDDEDDDNVRLRDGGIRFVHGIPSTALFPPNVSLCDGFGFACTNHPSVVISTALRCDGKSDCPDGSDELNCRSAWCLES